MAHVLTGGLDPGFEYFQAERPRDPGMRDSATLWVMDQSGRLALPRVTFDAIGESWETPWLQLNFVHADGRCLRVWSQEPGGLRTDAAGSPAIRSAGDFCITCVEPFRHWGMSFDGMAMQSTTEAELAGSGDQEPVPLAFAFEAEMAAPPWLMGGMTEQAARQMKAGDGAAAVLPSPTPGISSGHSWYSTGPCDIWCVQTWSRPVPAGSILEAAVDFTT